MNEFEELERLIEERKRARVLGGVQDGPADRSTSSRFHSNFSFF